MSLSVINGIFIVAILLGSAVNFIVYNEEVFILMDFCLFMTFAYKMVGDLIANDLDDRIARIQSEYAALRDMQTEKNETLKETHQIRVSTLTNLIDLFEYTEVKLEQTSVLTKKTLEVNAPTLVMQKFNFLAALEKQVVSQLHNWLAIHVITKNSFSIFKKGADFNSGFTLPVFSADSFKAVEDTSRGQFLKNRVLENVSELSRSIAQHAEKEASLNAMNLTSSDKQSYANLDTYSMTFPKGSSGKLKPYQLEAFAKSLFQPYASYKWVSPSVYKKHNSITDLNTVNVVHALINQNLAATNAGTSSWVDAENFGSFSSSSSISKEAVLLRV
jgi:hypothetical protein